MNLQSVIAPQSNARRLWERAASTLQLPGAALLVAASYYLSLQFAFAVRLPNSTFSPIWPPIAIMLAVLLLTPVHRWWIWIAASILAHLSFYTPLGSPLWRQAIQVTHNVSIVLLPAITLRRYAPEAVKLTTFRGVLTFLVTVVSTALLVPLMSAAVYVATGITDSFWLMWQLITSSNVLAYLTILPTILLVAQHGRRWFRQATGPRIIEAALLTVLVFAISEVVFGILPAGPLSSTILRIATLPLLLWAAVRFGPGGVSLAVTVMTIELLWNASLGNGPFTAATPTQNVLDVPSYFLTFAAPLLLLAALMADRRRSAAELVELNAQLEDRVARRTAELAQTNAQLVIARDQAESANRAKSTFLATMSHELRTPLHTIMGYNGLIMRSPVLPPEQQKHALIMQKSAEHLLSLINRVLDLSRIEAGRTPLIQTTVDLPQLLDDMIDMFRLQAEAKGLYVRRLRTADVPPKVFADAVKLRQVLINLLGNAVKFTESGGVMLAVSCELDARQPAAGERPIITLIFEVTDTGPGITPGEQQQMFEAFVQTQAGQRVGEGSGLGLALSRQFVHLMGGKLNVRSTPGNGATFIIRIPVQVASAGDLPNTSSLPQTITLAPEHMAYRVLVVDNHHDNRFLLATFLTSLGLTVREGHDGEEAIMIAKAWQPQLIFLDLQLPLVSGHEVAKQIRVTAHEPPVIIALSASSFNEYGPAALAEEFDDFIRRPFHITDIAEALHRHLDTRLPDKNAHDPATPDARLDLAALAALPGAQLALLERVSVGGNPQQITAAIAEIRSSHAELGATLQTLADQVAFDLILEAVRGVQKPEKTKNERRTTSV